VRTNVVPELTVEVFVAAVKVRATPVPVKSATTVPLIPPITAVKVPVTAPTFCGLK
jgi:hypothetical protein